MKDWKKKKIMMEIQRESSNYDGDPKNKEEKTYYW